MAVDLALGEGDFFAAIEEGASARTFTAASSTRCVGTMPIFGAA